MPLYDVECAECGMRKEVIANVGTKVKCPKCDNVMEFLPASYAYFKVKGGGGYPSRRKQIFNTTMRKHPKLT